ncbi:MAG: hypothetical protein WKG07_15920 [Hymenobacter sp.]
MSRTILGLLCVAGLVFRLHAGGPLRAHHALLPRRGRHHVVEPGKFTAFFLLILLLLGTSRESDKSGR